MKILKPLHSVTGTVIAVFFFMWFFTGLVLIYHPYPRLDEKMKNHYSENIQADSLRPMAYYTDSLLRDTVKEVKLTQMLGQPRIKITTASGSTTFCADTTEKKKKVKFKDAERIAARWIEGKPAQVDTLHEREQWILYERYEKAMPIYKLTYDDKDRHELFISGKTGEVQQLTTRSERVWAWLGAIPHKFYYPCIRKDLDIWKTVITTGGIICLLAALSGLLRGISVQWKVSRKRRKMVNPFKKPSYKWHHLFGLIFGIFIVCWGISGSLAMQKVPKWLVTYEKDYSMYAPDIWEGDSLPLAAYKLDYRKVIAAYPDVKRIEWHVIGGKPVYTVMSDSNEVFVDASDTVAQPLHVSAKAVKDAMQRIYGKETPVRVELINEYDQYYMPSYDNRPALPVYKATVSDSDGSVYYIGTDNDFCRYFNNNKKVRKWLFGAMHYLNINGIVSNPPLWHCCIWILCVGGMIVSFTGIILGIRYIRRKLKR